MEGGSIGVAFHPHPGGDLPPKEGRQRFNVLGALNAVTHEVVTVTNTPYIAAESVCALLVQWAERAGGERRWKRLRNFWTFSSCPKVSPS
jgi:hypothetical protein